jgi:Spy/CpxP family protein refolding chaperone
MKTMNRTGAMRSAGWTICCLVLALTASPFAGKPISATGNDSSPPTAPSEERTGPSDRMLDALMNPRLLGKLGLDDKQEAQLDEKLYTIMKQKIDRERDLELSRLEMMRVLAKFPVDAKALRKQGESLAEAEKQLRLLKLQMLEQLATLLTAEQHAKLLKMQREMRSGRGGGKGDRSDHGGRGDRSGSGDQDQGGRRGPPPEQGDGPEE